MFYFFLEISLVFQFVSPSLPFSAWLILPSLLIVILSLCDTSASIVGRSFGKFTPKLPFQPFFGANKSLAGTTGAMFVGYLAAKYFWGTLAVQGDEGDSSWLLIRSGWEAGSQGGWMGRLGSPRSGMGLEKLSLLSGFVAGFAEVCLIL